MNLKHHEAKLDYFDPGEKLLQILTMITHMTILSTPSFIHVKEYLVYVPGFNIPNLLF